MHTSGGVLEQDAPDLAVYVTHGTQVPIKALAKRFSGKKIHILAAYDKDIGYSILNKSVLAASIGRDNIPSFYTKEKFIELIDEIKTQCFENAPDVMLCVDGNLGDVAGVAISETFLQLVRSIAPKFLFPFSETPDCVDSAQRYLLGEEVVFGKESITTKYRLPSEVKIGQASNRAEISDVISGVLNRKVTLNPICVGPSNIDEINAYYLGQTTTEYYVEPNLINSAGNDEKKKKRSCFDFVMSFFTSKNTKKIVPTDNVESTDKLRSQETTKVESYRK